MKINHLYQNSLLIINGVVVGVIIVDDEDAVKSF
jgi:hypothetical protein